MSALDEQRKRDHIRIAKEENVSPEGVSSGFERYRLPHVALPEADLSDVSLATSFLGRPLAAPLLISSMTGGTDEAGRLNRELAAAAQEFGLALALGSARVAAEDRTLIRTFQVRDVAPDILLMANLGLVQLNYGFGYDECMWIVDQLRADALVLHLNPLQEALQPEGNTRFAGLLSRLEGLAQRLPVPIVVKEVGWGISGAVAERLIAAGAAAIDVAGAGGTSWSEVERFRISDPALEQVAEDFSAWGIPTAEAIVDVRRCCPDAPLIGSGGIRNGVELAKALALGADIGAAALPFLKAVSESPERLRQEIRRFVEGLRIAVFCAGLRDANDLRGQASLQTTSLTESSRG